MPLNGTTVDYRTMFIISSKQIHALCTCCHWCVISAFFHTYCSNIFKSLALDWRFEDKMVVICACVMLSPNPQLYPMAAHSSLINIFILSHFSDKLPNLPNWSEVPPTHSPWGKLVGHHDLLVCVGCQQTHRVVRHIFDDVVALLHFRGSPVIAAQVALDLLAVQGRVHAAKVIATVVATWGDRKQHSATCF